MGSKWLPNCAYICSFLIITCAHRPVQKSGTITGGDEHVEGISVSSIGHQKKMHSGIRLLPSISSTKTSMDLDANMNSSSSSSLIESEQDECAGVMWFVAAFAFKRTTPSEPNRLKLAEEYLELEHKTKEDLISSGADIAQSVTIQVLTPEKQPRSVRHDQDAHVQGTPAVELGTTWKSVWTDGGEGGGGGGEWDGDPVVADGKEWTSPTPDDPLMAAYYKDADVARVTVKWLGMQPDDVKDIPISKLWSREGIDGFRPFPKRIDGLPYGVVWSQFPLKDDYAEFAAIVAYDHVEVHENVKCV